MKPIIIAGGGIGRLSTALDLAKNGFSVVVLERASTLGEIGAGIQFGPNAFHAFDYVGVGDAARAMAVYVDRLRLMDAMTVEDICSIDLGENFRARFGNPYAVVHRADLHGVFVSACRAHANIALCRGCAVERYEQDGGTVSVFLANGEMVQGSLLVGADGLWSKIRQQVVGDGAPRVTGHTTYRSVIPTEPMPEDLRRFAGVRGRGDKRLRARPSKGARHHSPRQGLEALGAMRP